MPPLGPLFPPPPPLPPPPPPEKKKKGGGGGGGGGSLPMWARVMSSLPSLPPGLVNFSAGFGDGWTLGLTSLGRSALGAGDQVNTGSGAYLGGALTAAGTQASLGAGAAIGRFGANSAMVGKGSTLFGRGAPFGAKGALNSGAVRVGWSWKGSRTSGKDVFRVSWATRGNGSWWNHLDFN